MIFGDIDDNKSRDWDIEEGGQAQSPISGRGNISILLVLGEGKSVSISGMSPDVLTTL